MNARCGGLNVEVREVVNGVEKELSDLQELGFIDLLCPPTFVVVSSDGGDGSDDSQFFKNAWIADIAGVDDEVAAF